MGLSLSTLAAPDLGLEAFAAACLSRGLDGAEIVISDGDDLDEVAVRITAARARIVALRVPSLDARSAPAFAAASARLGVPVSTPAEAGVLGELSDLVACFARANGRLLLGMGTSLEGAVELMARVRTMRAGDALGVALEIRPATESLADASAVLFACREHLGLVRLHGGGPEQRAQEGLGIGAFLTDLALSRYEGPIVLCPSRPELLGDWAKWLASTKSAGCGSKVAPRVLALDVRDVEPRDRLETILGAYASLSPGETMTLTVDHDPSCMYFTLKATEPEGSFEFQTVDHGPEVWRAEVTKR